MAYVTDGQPEKVDEFAGRYPTVHQTAQNTRHKLWGDDLLYCILANNRLVLNHFL